MLHQVLSLTMKKNFKHMDLFFISFEASLSGHKVSSSLNLYS